MFKSKRFKRLLAMPNLKPPIRNIISYYSTKTSIKGNVSDAISYKKRIMDAIESTVTNNTTIDVLMTIYLTDNTTEQDIYDAKKSGHFNC